MRIDEELFPFQAFRLCGETPMVEIQLMGGKKFQQLLDDKKQTAGKKSKKKKKKSEQVNFDEILA